MKKIKLYIIYSMKELNKLFDDIEFQYHDESMKY